MRQKLSEGFGIGLGTGGGSILYQFFRSGAEDIHFARGLFIALFVGVVWLLVPIRIFRKPGIEGESAGRESGPHQVDG